MKRIRDTYGSARVYQNFSGTWKVELNLGGTLHYFNADTKEEAVEIANAQTNGGRVVIEDSKTHKSMKRVKDEYNSEAFDRADKAIDEFVERCIKKYGNNFTLRDLDDEDLNELDRLTEKAHRIVKGDKVPYESYREYLSKTSDSRKIKDAEGETPDVLDGILLIAFDDGEEENGYNEVKKHANEQGTIDGVQYETYDTDYQDGATLIDLCAATDDANAFVKALLTEWGIIDAVADIEFEKSELMENAEVSDSRKVSDYRSPLDVIENAFNSVANELGTERLSPKFYEKVNKYIKTYPIAEGGNSCTIVYQGAEYDVSYDFRDNRFYATKDKWNMSEAIEERRKLLGVSDSKVEDMTKPAHLRGYAERQRKKRRETKGNNETSLYDMDLNDDEIYDSERVSDMIKPAHLRGYAEKYRQKRRNQKNLNKEENLEDENTDKQSVSDSRNRKVKDAQYGKYKFDARDKADRMRDEPNRTDWHKAPNFPSFERMYSEEFGGHIYRDADYIEYYEDDYGRNLIPFDNQFDDEFDDEY